jgi:hypothetical protein
VATVTINAQPLDSDLTAIASLTTTTFGRALLTEADAASLRSTLALGSAALSSTAAFDTAGDALAAKLAAEAAVVYELEFQAGVVIVPYTSFARIGARIVDMSKYPNIAGYTRHVRLLCNVEKTSGATSGTVQLWDTTHNVLVASTSMSTTSSTNEEKDSGDLTVGSSSGNIRSDVASSYEVQLKVTGGTLGVDAATIANARLMIYYT